MLNAESSSLEPAETDDLLATINEQLTAGTFDGTDTLLLQSVVAALGDGRGMVRFGFVEALGQIGKPAVPFLLASLQDHPNPVVRRSCGKALAKIGDPQAIPTLIYTLLNDEDTVARSSAAGALAKMGTGAVTALLEVLAGDYPETAKGHAAWAIAFIGAPGLDQLYRAMASESADVRMAVVGAIASIVQEYPDERSLTLIVSALDDPAAVVRAEAATALGILTYKPAIPQLIQLLSDSSIEVRRAIGLALGKMGDATVLAPLQEQLVNEVEEVRPVLALAIAQIQKRQQQ